MSDATPMMRQYRRIKRQHADAILFYRLGDFYEMFESDAKKASSILNLTLTKRHNIPMCGLPYHAAGTYIARLLDAGQKIAVCEQTVMPVGGKGIAEREVVQIITPGTVVDEDYLDKSTNNYLTAIGESAGSVSLSSIDLSTGELRATLFPTEERLEGVRRELQRLGSREILVQESMLESDAAIERLLNDSDRIMINRFPDWDFDVETSAEKLLSQLSVSNLKGFGVNEETEGALLSVGVLLDYVADTQKSLLPHITDISIYRDTDYLGLDETTQRNLELVKNLSDGGEKYTLLQVLDHTRTSMGARMLKRWILNPLTDLDSIRQRSETVETVYRNQLYLSSLKEELGSILDIERLAARVALDRAHGKDMLAIANALRGCLNVEKLSAE
jgi:DNA mismatch repair protein MutS